MKIGYNVKILDAKKPSDLARLTLKCLKAGFLSINIKLVYVKIVNLSTGFFNYKYQ